MFLTVEGYRIYLIEYIYKNIITIISLTIAVQVIDWSFYVCINMLHLSCNSFYGILQCENFIKITVLLCGKSCWRFGSPSKNLINLYLFFQLAAISDVFVENYVPGKLAEMGLGYEDVDKIAPHIIYCSITGISTLCYL